MAKAHHSGHYDGPSSPSESDFEHGLGEAVGSIPLKELPPPDGELHDEEESFLQRQPRIKGFELYSPEEDKAVLKRLDRRLVLFMAFLYMLSFLDRSSRSMSTRMLQWNLN